MNDIQNLLAQLANLDIRVWLDADELRFNAPPGVVTADLQETLRQRQQELRAFLKSRGDSQNTGNVSAAELTNKATVSRLGAGQERLYSLARHAPKSSVYNVPMVFRVKGHLDILALEKALSLIQERHEALRLVFRVSQDGIPLQEPLNAAPVVVPVHDLRRAIAGLATPVATAAVRREIEADVQRPLDLEKGPPWRASLFRLGTRDHILAFTMHHIVFDGASKPVFLGELEIAYNAFRNGQNPALPRLPKGFLTTLNASIAGIGKTVDADREYWSRQFAGGVEPTMLPNDRERSAQKGQMRSLSIQLPKGLASKLDAASSAIQSTPFLLVLLAVFITLYRYVQQKDMIICTAAANRGDEAAEKLVGYFNNVLPIRLAVEEELSIRDLALRLRRSILGALDHQKMPLQDIVSLPELVRTPLTRVLFSFQDKTGSKLNLSEAECDTVIIRKGVADFELAIYVEAAKDEVSALIDYDASLFDSATIKRFAHYYQECVSYVASTPQLNLNGLTIIDPIPETVGAMLKTHPQLEDAVVTHQSNSGTLHAYVVANEYDVPSLPAIRDFIGRSFPHWRVPATFSTVDQLPLQQDGTVDVAALPRPTRDRGGLSTPYAPARTELESLLIDIWRRILWVDYDIGIHDRFQELGGHSLLSVQIISEFEKSLGKSIPNSCLAHFDSIATFCAAIEATEADGVVITPTPDHLPDDILRGMRSFTASWAGKRSTPESLTVGLNDRGSKPNLFWCLQRYGELTQLAKYLGPDQPVYGMRSANRVMPKTEENKEMLARHYASEILEIQTGGEFFVGGNCQAAEIAFKIARYLRSAGHQIGLLMLHERFVPEPYDGKVLLTFGQQSTYNPFYYYGEPSRGWRKYYTGHTGVMLVPGAHGQYFREPNVQVLAKTLSDSLAATLTGSFGTSLHDGVDLSAYRLREEAYRAEISVAFDSSGQAGMIWPLAVTVRNLSPVTWEGGELSGLAIVGCWRRPEASSWSPPFGVSHLMSRVPPGATESHTLQLRCPEEPGPWTLQLDVIDEGITYFSSKGSKALVKTVHITQGNV